MFSLLISIIKGMIFFTGSYGNSVFKEPLKKDEEEKYIKEMINGNKEARNKLIEHNLRLVAHIVKKYERDEELIDDLISIGTIGLIKGIDSYKPNTKTRITTYAARCIENEILMYYRANKKYKNTVSLNDSIGFDKDGNDITLEDVIPTKETDISTKVAFKENVGYLKKYLSNLNNREKKIIIARYGLNNKHELTQKEIAKKLNISRSYVSRIEKRAMTKILALFIKNKKDDL